MTRFRLNRSKLTLWAVLLVLAVAAPLLRLHRLDELAPGLKFDEGWNGIYALEVLQGEHALIFGDKEGLGVYLIALTTKFLGRTPLALRLPTALASASTVFVVFWLGRLLFGWDEGGRENRWRGIVIGGVASCLVCLSLSGRRWRPLKAKPVSLGQTILGRTAYRASFLPLFLALSLALLWWGWTRRHWWGIVLAGACTGLLPYVYYPARFVPFLFLIFGMSFLLPFRSTSLKKVNAQKPAAHCCAFWPGPAAGAVLPWAATFAVVAGLVAAPILFHYIRHPDLFFNRHVQALFIFREFQGASVITLGGVLAANVWDVLSTFSFRLLAGCCSPFEHAVTLHAWEAFFFWLGVGTAAWQWKQRPACRLLLLWIGLLFLPAFLTDAKSTMRMVGAVPAIYLLVAVGVWELARWSASRMPVTMTSWPSLFGTVISVVVLVQGVTAYRTVFEKGMAASDDHYNMIWPTFAQRLNAQPAEQNTVYFIAQRHDSFDYLYQGATPFMRIFTDVPDLDHHIEAALADMRDVTTVKIVNWADWSPTIEWRSNHKANFLTILLDKYGRHVGTEEFDGIYVDSYVDISRNRPWTLFEDLPRSVIFDGGITLEGLALGSSRYRLPSGQSPGAEQNRSLLVGMLWRKDPDLAIDYSISLRLYNVEDARVFQTDHVLRKPMAYSLTTSLWTSQPVDTVFELEIPNELAAGEYELRLVVYDLETSTPTVEVGVWEPETALGKVQLQTSGQ